MNRPSFPATVIHCEPMNPKNLPSKKTGQPWQLYKVHCVIDLGDGQRVCQLVNNDPVAPGRYVLPLTLGERDGRAVFQVEGFVPVAAADRPARAA